MRRLINMRIMLIAALCEILFILLLCLYSSRFALGLVLLIVFYIGGIISCAVCFKISPKRWFPALLISLSAIVLTHVSFMVQWRGYHNTNFENGTEYTVSGTIDSISKDDNKLISACLSDIVSGEREIDGKIQVIFQEDDIVADRVQMGDRITVHGKLYAVDLIDDGKVNGTAYRRDLRYRLYASFANCTFVEGNPGIFVCIRAAIYSRLQLACGERYGAIAYCMLTGDKGELDNETLDLYNASGIGHILAVSGLHVGLLAAILGFVLGKLRVGAKARVGIITGVLVAYSFFVGMAASVVRAVIMCVIALFTQINGQRKDALSSWCFAFTVLLIVQPFLLFEVGFLLSFTAVLGIILFARTFTQALCRIRIPAWLAKPFAASAAVHLSILPVTVYFFGTLQTYSVLFNLLLVPFLSLAFACFLLLTPICILFGWNAPLRLGASCYAFGDLCIGITRYLPLNSLYVHSHKGLFLLYLAFFAASGYCMLPKYKRLSSCGILCLCAVIVAAPTLATLQPSKEVYRSLIPVSGFGDVTTIVVDDEITVIGDLKNTAALRSALQRHSIRKINTIAVHRLDRKVGSALIGLLDSISVDKIVCPMAGISADGLTTLGQYKYFYAWEEVRLPNLMHVVDSEGSHSGFGYRFSDLGQVLFLSYSSQYANLSAATIDLYPVIRCFMFTGAYPDRIYLTDMPKGYIGKEPAVQFSVADLGEFAFRIDTGTVLQR